MSREWTEEQKEAASKRMKEINVAKKSADASQRVRVPIGTNRDVTAVRTTPDGYTDRWVNDKPSRIERFKQAGYEHVESAQVGDVGVEGTHSENGVVSRDMGKGETAYLMRQRQDYFDEDQATKQRDIDKTVQSLRRDKIKSTESTDGSYGEVRITK